VTWPRALTYLGLWVALTGYYLAFEQAPRTVVESDGRRPQDQVRVLPEGTGTITRFEIEAPGHALRSELVGGQWEVVDPAGVRVPSDLLHAIVDALLDVHATSVVRGSPPPQAEIEFGLDRPRARLTLSDGSSRTTLQLGSPNPARTAVYARREGHPEVLLLGLNVQYYVDLLLEALRRQTT
jgi:hypothetical protein